MALSLVTAPAIEPVTLREVKLQCRLDPDQTDEDDLLETLRRDAREWVENATGRKLIQQTWDWKLDGWPCSGVFVLPFAPVSAVTSISYLDQDGVTQTLATSVYTTDLPVGPWAQRGRIDQAFAQYYPIARLVMNSVTVRLVAGYGTTSESVPAGLRTLIKLMTAHMWNAGREPVVIGVGYTVQEVPSTLSDRIWEFKTF